MNYTPSPPHLPFPPAAALAYGANSVFAPTPFVAFPPGTTVVTVSPQVETLGTTAGYLVFRFHLPRSTRVGDKVEVFFLDFVNSISILAASVVIDHYSLFHALYYGEGVFTISEVPEVDLINNGLIPGLWALLVLFNAPPTPRPFPPAVPGPQTPTTVVANSLMQNYTIL